MVDGSSQFHSLCHFQYIKWVRKCTALTVCATAAGLSPQNISKLCLIFGSGGGWQSSNFSWKLSIRAEVCPLSALLSTVNAREEYQMISIERKWVSSDMAWPGYFSASEISRSSIYVVAQKIKIKQHQARAFIFDQCVVRRAITYTRVLSEGACPQGLQGFREVRCCEPSAGKMNR